MAANALWGSIRIRVDLGTYRSAERHANPLYLLRDLGDSLGVHLTDRPSRIDDLRHRIGKSGSPRLPRLLFPA